MKAEPEKNWFCQKTRHGTVELFDGLVSYDRHWRERSLLKEFEAEFVGKKLTKAQIAALQQVDTSIEFICGKPGGGKSMYATKLIIDELIHGTRPIVTNLALNLSRLQEYLDECGHRIHVTDRVRILEKEEITEFYLRRGQLTLKLPPPGERFMDWTPSQNDAQSAGGVMYVIDECHNYLHPYAFGNVKLTPEHPLMQYATQHRKLKDTCFLVTQSVENVHVQIRRLGQQFSYIRNLRKETFRGFRRGEGFSRTVYLVPPTSDAAVPIDSSDFRLDVRGLASCYFTAGGVGIAAAGTGDGGAKKKGLNLKWIYGFGLAALLVLAVFLKYGSEFAVRKVVGETMVHGVPQTKPASVVASEVKVSETAKDGSPVMVSDPGPVFERVMGTMMRGNTLLVAVGGRGFLAALSSDRDSVELEGGLRVRRSDVYAGRSPSEAKPKP